MQNIDYDANNTFTLNSCDQNLFNYPSYPISPQRRFFSTSFFNSNNNYKLIFDYTEKANYENESLFFQNIQYRHSLNIQLLQDEKAEEIAMAKHSHNLNEKQYKKIDEDKLLHLQNYFSNQKHRNFECYSQRQQENNSTIMSEFRHLTNLFHLIYDSTLNPYDQKQIKQLMEIYFSSINKLSKAQSKYLDDEYNFRNQMFEAKKNLSFQHLSKYSHINLSNLHKLHHLKISCITDLYDAKYQVLTMKHENEMKKLSDVYSKIQNVTPGTPGMLQALGCNTRAKSISPGMPSMDLELDSTFTSQNNQMISDVVIKNNSKMLNQKLANEKSLTDLTNSQNKEMDDLIFLTNKNLELFEQTWNNEIKNIMIEKSKCINQLKNKLNSLSSTPPTSASSPQSELNSLTYSNLYCVTEILTESVNNLILYSKNIESSQQKKYNDTIGHIYKYLNDIKKYATLKTNKYQPFFESFNFSEFLNTFLSNFSNQLPSHIKLTTTIDSICPGRVSSDKSLLTSILLRLLGNAQRFTSQGTINVVLSVLSAGNHHSTISLTVTDTGTGIPPEIAAHIFEPLNFDCNHNTRLANNPFHPDNSYIRHSIGLPLADAMAHFLNGQLKYEKPKNQENGSTFILIIPLQNSLSTTNTPFPFQEIGPQHPILSPAPVESFPIFEPQLSTSNITINTSSYSPSTVSSSQKDNTPDISYDFKKFTFNELPTNIPPNTSVLLVDDDIVIVKLLKSKLLKQNCDLRTASNGIKALEECKKKEFDIILMDITMPVLDGEKTTIQLRQSGYKGIIIAITMNASEDDKQRYLQAGMNDLVSKPVVFKDMVNIMIHCLAKYKPQSLL